jgi:thiamine pyrophosphate-dependent acetolactate synthase large subunit-like protein
MNDITLDRREVLAPLFPEPGDWLFVSGLAGAARDVCALTGETENVFAMGGAMGAAVSMALGVALSVPQQRVACVTGDGELLMNLGALATVASVAPENLVIVCIDNARHGETGGQLGHTARRTDLAAIASGAGIAAVHTIAAPGDLAAAARFIAGGTGPRFLWARVKDGPPQHWSRNWNLAECRLRFRNAWMAKTATAG